MKLLQSNKAYSPHLGGIETVVQQLAEGFAGEGWQSEVLVANDHRRSSTEMIGPVAVHRVATLARVMSLPLAPSYPFVLARRRADVLLVHEPSLLAALTLWVGGRRTRAHFGRIAVWWHSEIVRQSSLSRLYRPFMAALLRAADDIIVASPNHIASSTFLTEFASKVRVIPFGVDLGRFQVDEGRADRVRRLRKRYGDKMVLYVGRLATYKGIDVLADAMSLVHDAHFVIVGEGSGDEVVRRSPAYRSGRVTVVPHVAESDLIDLYHACSLFVLPSTQNSEAFGIVQLEAMACAKPVVSFDLPTGVTYVNQHGRTGLVAPVGDTRALADCINMLLGDDDLRIRLGRQARHRVEAEFTVEAMVRSTVGVLGSPTPSRVGGGEPTTRC